MNENKSHALGALAGARTATLSVIDFETGYPMGSLVNIATCPEGMPLLLISALARHHKCLVNDKRASLLVAQPAANGDPLTGLRAGFQGPMIKLNATAELRAAYIAKHSYAEGYVDFADFAFWRMRPELVHVVAGFGRIETIRL